MHFRKLKGGLATWARFKIQKKKHTEQKNNLETKYRSKFLTTDKRLGIV